MELRQLRYILAVAEAGSLLAAAERLHIAQPALGQQISKLETELGIKLFERSRKGMQATAAGKIFLEHARLILTDVERAKAAVGGFATVPHGTVTLGLPTSVALIATIPLLQACHEQLPQVQLNVVEAYSGFLREWLLAGRVDVAILMGDGSESGLTQTPLLVDQLVFVAGSQEATALPAKLSMKMLTRWPLILPGRGHGLRQLIDKAALDNAVPLRVTAEIDSLGSVKRAAQAGLGYTILPASAVAEEVRQRLLHTVAIESPFMDRQIGYATNISRPQTAASTAVAHLLHTVLHEMVATGSWPARWIGTEPT